MVRLPPFISDMVGWAPSPNPKPTCAAENGVFSYPWRFCPGMLKSTAKIHPRGSQVCVRSALLLLPLRCQAAAKTSSGDEVGGLCRGREGGKEVYKGHLDNGCIGGMPWKTLGSQWVAYFFLILFELILLRLILCDLIVCPVIFSCLSMHPTR